MRQRIELDISFDQRKFEQRKRRLNQQVSYQDLLSMIERNQIDWRRRISMVIEDSKYLRIYLIWFKSITSKEVFWRFQIVWRISWDYIQSHNVLYELKNEEIQIKEIQERKEWINRRSKIL